MSLNRCLKLLYFSYAGLISKFVNSGHCLKKAGIAQQLRHRHYPPSPIIIIIIIIQTINNGA